MLQENVGLREGIVAVPEGDLGNGSGLEKKCLLEALTALKNGDFTQRLPIDCVGLDGKIADTFNGVMEIAGRMASELQKLNHAVGKEGRISQRLTMGDVSGAWSDSAQFVNSLLDDLVHPTIETSRVIGAVAKGDLQQSMALDVGGRPLQGEFLKTATTVNLMVEQLSTFTSEVTRVAREVGTEGKLGGQAKVKGVAGTWKDLTDSVNLMAGNLTSQVRNIAAVTTAVANGDLSKKITVDVKGEILELKNTVNTMVDQLSSFASEVTRVAREVGTEGILGGQAQVKGIAGTWKDLTENVNFMAGNLTSQVRNIAAVTTAVANGDLSKKITVDVKGEILELKNTVNTMVDQLSSFASEVTRVAREVGTEGILGGQAQVKGVAGTWKDLTDSVNSMARNLTAQVRNIAEVTTAVASGDLSKKITVDVRGEILGLKDTINTMVDQLRSFASEVTRVAREVGSEGSLGGQADVKGVSGTWKDLTDNVNSMARNLTAQVRNIAEVTTAIANGDLSRQITVDVKGEILEMKNTINTLVDRLSSFASEVTRVAREVGTEGILGGQANVRGVAGTWKDLTDSVNFMAGNLTSQVRNIAAVTTAVANGDLSKKITVDVKGEILELKVTINTMVDQLSSFASEVTRVAREVGSEGILGGQADVQGVAGTWKDLTESVNSMAANLTGQVRNIAAVTTAVANGDLSKKISVDVKGEILELKNTINTMVDQLSSFASEVTRVAREVGSEGKLGGQADVKGVAGTWKDLTDSVNFMGGNLTAQVRNIADVTTAVANGDLSKKITVDVKGEILELKNTINTMVDQLNSFASEVTRVAREVGSEGKLGGQADVKGVAGTWKDLTDSVNFMGGNLTAQVRNIADVTKAVASGDLSKKITVDVKGEILELKNTINTMVDQLNSFASEVTRVAREVGTEGKLGGQAVVQGVAGTWKDLTDNVNFMAGNLTGQVRNIADVTKAVASGDLSKKITVDVKGEIFQLKDTINTMVDQLRSFASEVTRVAREVGTEGKLGGQAIVEGVGGTWKDLTDNVNFMAGNLTSQVRGIAKVVTAVARGDLKRKLTVEAKGEIAELADTINSMTDTLATFAQQVTTVAREVGVEGKLGGQASVPGASGTWKDLTDNVNQLAANLTTQVRAIADVATAVTKGDLTRSIKVEAQGEVAALKDYINEMIRNLKDTTLKNSEQDWLKTNLAKFSRMLQGQKDLLAVGKMILSELAPVVTAQRAVIYTVNSREGDTSVDTLLQLLAGYAASEATPRQFQLGEGLVGQCAVEGKKIYVQEVPPSYVKISSGLGETTPKEIIVLPVLFEGTVKAVMELASFERFSPTHQMFLDQLMESIGIVLNTIEANSRTENLLKQSQSLAAELQTRQQELQNKNQELQEKAQLLADRNVDVERKNQEVEQARKALEEKAEQLALTSKYKSEFLANMSHELRTPLNSLLILSDQLAKNMEGNLIPRQVDFARTIYDSGNDLLALINDILDLSKIESGTVSVDINEIGLVELREYVERNFRHIAEAKHLGFEVYMDPRIPESIESDEKRIQQIFKNLLSNAFKFTSSGGVTFEMKLVPEEWVSDFPSLRSARSIISFSVVDTGIGIQPDKHQIIFEAFQQEDGSTSRRYGGTGLGLAISREISRMLGGEIRLESVPNQGSRFTLYLPVKYPYQHAPTSITAIGSTPAPRLDADETAPITPQMVRSASETVGEFEDDRARIQPGDKSLLIVDNDQSFVNFLRDLARQHNFKTLITAQGSVAVSLAQEYKPTAITLDLRLTDINGWRVLNHLKHDPASCHIPVHIISTDDQAKNGFRAGALSVLEKPVSTESLSTLLAGISKAFERPRKKVACLSLKDGQRKTFERWLNPAQVDVINLSDAKELLEIIQQDDADCIVIPAKESNFSAAAFLGELRKKQEERPIPTIIRRLPSLAAKELAKLEQMMKSWPLRIVSTPEELYRDCVIYLGLEASVFGEEGREILLSLQNNVDILAGKNILVVDDDIRNIFAMTSILERFKMNVVSSENGRDAIQTLDNADDIDVVVMDVMMPGMDGYDTMREIRKDGRFGSLPIIAVTAKAMKGDREKCLEAGASDYLAKPVDTAKLIAILRTWLFPGGPILTPLQ